ncbi:MAG TPA: DUF4203 domain-containing protein [Candidatus Sumerlaeota bacterium]|nr:DUF4203 domain-containing protein [Candidatus Sumerlaeota bacterium]
MFFLCGYSIKAAPFIAGAVLAFLGWTLYWTGLNLTGASLGATLGTALGWGAAMLFQRHDLLLPSIIACALLGALVGVFLARTIHKIFFFLTGCVFGVAVGVAAAQYLRKMGYVQAGHLAADVGIKAACGLAGGFLMLFLHGYIVMIATSAVGTLLMVYSIGSQNYTLLIPFIFLSALIFQIALVRLRGKRFLSRGKDDD